MRITFLQFLGLTYFRARLDGENAKVATPKQLDVIGRVARDLELDLDPSDRTKPEITAMLSHVLRRHKELTSA